MKISFWKPKTSATPPATGKNKGKTHSFFAILFSVFVAFLLWLYVQEAEAPNYRKTFTAVDVQVQNLSSSFSVIEGTESTVDVTLVGKRSDLNKIKSADLEAYLDLSDITRAGEYQKEISVMAPDGTDLAECFPQKVSLFVDETISLAVPMKVDVGNYTVLGENTGVEAVPLVQEITVKGPKSLLEQIDCAKASTGDLGEVTTAFEKNCDYELYNGAGEVLNNRHIALGQKSVRVRVSIYKTKTVPLVVACKNGFWQQDAMRSTVTPAQIVIKGEPALIDATESVPAIVLDERELDSNRYSATLSPSMLALPDGIALGETIGDVKVTLSLIDNVSRSISMNFNSTHVVVTPPNSAFTYRMKEEALTFRIRGTSAEVATAKADDFYINIDLSSLRETGEHEVEVQVVQTSASENRFYVVGTYRVGVVIEAV